MSLNNGSKVKCTQNIDQWTLAFPLLIRYEVDVIDLSEPLPKGKHLPMGKSHHVPSRAESNFIFGVDQLKPSTPYEIDVYFISPQENIYSEPGTIVIITPTC